jgi:hypothetical protein
VPYADDEECQGGRCERLIPILAERKSRGWSMHTMATKLRDAADNPGEVSSLDSLTRNIRRWERAGTGGMTERYRLL